MVSPLFLLFVVFAINFFGLHHAYYYCNKELCPEGVQNFMCNHSVIPKEGTYLANLPITNKIRRFFIDTHNGFREKTASGEEKGDGKPYPKAARMRALIWDEEMAYIAYVHSKQCSFNHDECRNTKRFKFCGQNLGYRASTKVLDPIVMMNESFHLMYNEKENISDPKGMTVKYESILHTKLAGHFTLLVSDQVARFGCALAYCKDCVMSGKKSKPKPHCYYMTCIYDGTNVGNVPVYKPSTTESGSLCSDWGTGKHSDYPNLCANSGKIFPFEMPEPEYYD